MIHIFIVNPYAGKKTFADDLREKLKNIDGLNYFVFNTRNAGYETELIDRVVRIFQGEKLRFYCCGGSGTMRNMLSGFDSLEDVEVAFFPCGLTNDFLKVFGEKEKLFYDIEELINGEVMEVDYIRTNHGIALNTLSTGLDAHCQTKMESYRVLTILGRQTPYSLSLLSGILFAKNNKYTITVDEETFEDVYTEVFFGNGFVLGGGLYFDYDANIQDGKFIYSFVKGVYGIKRIKTMLAIGAKNFKKVENILQKGMCSQVTIKKTDGTPFVVNHDGELVKDVTEVHAQVIRKGLHLVVPKGVIS
ncbi:MAG: hypothetical protein E7258_09040 [Lachnospiraceae bacterium]|nr:hypothetical protein [Lachnospiraceae bacterium]